MRESVSQVDLLVIGGGMAGLSAAAYAARNGAGVVLVEKGPAVGGSAAYARYIHTAPTVEVMREVNPGADPKLSSRLVESFDSAIEWVRSLRVHMDRFQLARERGARAVIAEDIDELEALPEEWGYPQGAVRDTLREFNEQCRTGKLSPDRKLDAAPLVDPPYYVIEVMPAITHPYGGLRIDERARALDADGTPIEGLFAAGADAGGVFHRAYAGGLTSALVFGLEAARTAITDRAVVS